MSTISPPIVHNSKSQLIDLPIEIRRCIINHLDALSIRLLSLCCHKLRQSITSDTALLERHVVAGNSTLAHLSTDQTSGGMWTHFLVQLFRHSPHQISPIDRFKVELKEGKIISIHDTLANTGNPAHFVQWNLPESLPKLPQSFVDPIRHVLWTKRKEYLKLWKLPLSPISHFTPEDLLLDMVFDPSQATTRIFWCDNGGTLILLQSIVSTGNVHLSWYNTNGIMKGDKNPIQTLDFSLDFGFVGPNRLFVDSQTSLIAILRADSGMHPTVNRETPFFISEEYLASLPVPKASIPIQSSLITTSYIVEVWDTNDPSQKLFCYQIPWQVLEGAVDDDGYDVLPLSKMISLSRSGKYLVINPLPQICLLVDIDVVTSSSEAFNNKQIRSLVCNQILNRAGSLECSFSCNERFIAIGDYEWYNVFDLRTAQEPLYPSSISSERGIEVSNIDSANITFDGEYFTDDWITDRLPKWEPSLIS